ncbi:hypothetical protein WUBG_08966, partial [Wuchereria bancrofti]
EESIKENIKGNKLRHEDMHLAIINNSTLTTNKHPKIKHHELLKYSRTEITNIVYAERTTFTIVSKLRSNRHRSVPLIIVMRSGCEVVCCAVCCMIALWG